MIDGIYVTGVTAFLALAFFAVTVELWGWPRLDVAAITFNFICFSWPLNLFAALTGVASAPLLRRTGAWKFWTLGFGVLAGAQIYDIALFFGLRQGDYVSKYYHLLVACLFAVMLLRRSTALQTAHEMMAKAEAALGRMASQVAHDVRSPLAALGMVVQDLDGVSEDHRLLIRSAVGRINDIANVLLDRKRAGMRPTPDATQRGEQVSDEPLRLTSVAHVVDALVTEKRLQFRPKINVTIEAALGARAYGLFVRAQVVELKRLLSNVINRIYSRCRNDIDSAPSASAATDMVYS